MKDSNRMYLLNINSRTIHDASSTNGRCKIGMIREENRMLFTSYWVARHFLPDGKKVTTPCAFCLGVHYEEELDDKEGAQK